MKCLHVRGENNVTDHHKDQRKTFVCHNMDWETEEDTNEHRNGQPSMKNLSAYKFDELWSTNRIFSLVRICESKESTEVLDTLFFSRFGAVKAHKKAKGVFILTPKISDGNFNRKKKMKVSYSQKIEEDDYGF